MLYRSGEAWYQLLFVLGYAAFEVVCHADIERARSIGHDVDVDRFGIEMFRWRLAATGLGL